MPLSENSVVANTKECFTIVDKVGCVKKINNN